MRTWTELDDNECQFLVRSGVGIISSIDPVGIIDPNGAHTFFRVEIQCDISAGRTGNIRFKAQPLVMSDNPILTVARQALESLGEVAWQAEWRRLEWIPADLPISALNLVTDTQSTLVQLELSAVAAAFTDLSVPDFIPTEWAAHRND